MQKKVAIQTERLELEEVSMKHLQQVHELHSYPEVDKYNTLGIPKDIGETQQVIGSWLLRHQSAPRSGYVFYISAADKFIGLAGMNLGKAEYRIAEVWYKLLPAHWGRGYATEALAALLDFGFNELNLHRIEAGCAVENVASARVLEKAGMKLEGRKRGVLPIGGGWVDNYFFAILENDLLINK